MQLFTDVIDLKIHIETVHTKDVEQIPQSDGQNDDDTLVPVGRDEHDDDGATITQVDSSVMCQKLTDCNKCGKGFTSKDHRINHMESCS